MLSVDGRVTAQAGDVVLTASSVAVGSIALVCAPNGAVVLAAGQKVELTGRGLEGIRIPSAWDSTSAGAQCRLSCCRGAGPCLRFLDRVSGTGARIHR